MITRGTLILGNLHFNIGSLPLTNHQWTFHHEDLATEVSDQIDAYVSNIVRSKVHNGDSMDFPWGSWSNQHFN